MSVNKDALWRKWRRNMGIASQSDIQDARSWFDELYQAGLNGNYLKTRPGGEPLSYDERQVLEAGLATRTRV